MGFLKKKDAGAIAEATPGETLSSLEASVAAAIAAEATERRRDVLRGALALASGKAAETDLSWLLGLTDTATLRALVALYRARPRHVAASENLEALAVKQNELGPKVIETRNARIGAYSTTRCMEGAAERRRVIAAAEDAERGILRAYREASKAHDDAANAAIAVQRIDHLLAELVASGKIQAESVWRSALTTSGDWK